MQNQVKRITRYVKFCMRFCAAQIFPVQAVSKSRGKQRQVVQQQPVQTTSTSQPLTLWCLIDGDPTPFDVSCPLDNNVHQMKKLLLEEGKHGVLRNVDAKDLVLWKV